MTSVALSPDALLTTTRAVGKRLCFDRPVGRAVIGRSEGDEVEVEAPRGAWKARIVSIRR